MIHSMTGFGKASVAVAGHKITIEVKSLNSKQLDLFVRIPQQYREAELDLRKEVAQALIRGKVEVNISCEAECGTQAQNINVPLLAHYKQQLEHAATVLGIDKPGDWYSVLLRLPDVMTGDSTADTLADDEARALSQAVSDALERLNEFRAQEGRRLETFFEERIDAIGRLLDQVPQYEQARVEKIKARITDALEHIDSVDYDHNRLEQELIYYIEKLDITEEKVRLRNHLAYFLDTLHGERGQGKKLGFIAQEMGREINTLGSKANQAELQKLVVLMKDNLEQIKEQVLNVL